MNRRESKFLVHKDWEPMLKALGIKPGDALRYAALPPDLFTRREQGLSTQAYFSLWRAMENLSGNSSFPLNLIQGLRNESFDPPIFAAYCSPNFKTAVERLQKFKPLLGPMSLEIQNNLEGLTLTVSFLDKRFALPHSLAGMELAFFVQLARMATREKIVPLKVTTPVELPAKEKYQEFLGVEPHRSESLSLTFSAYDVSRPFLSENDRMWEFFEPGLVRRLSEVQVEEGTAVLVRSCLAEMLPSGQTTVNALAGKLMVSRRTLQRKLHNEGTSFKTILTNVRKELAHHYILESDLPYSQISLLLGYEDPNSFFRAFQTWTGSTPDSVRKGSSIIPGVL